MKIITNFFLLIVMLFNNIPVIFASNNERLVYEMNLSEFIQFINEPDINKFQELSVYRQYYNNSNDLEFFTKYKNKEIVYEGRSGYRLVSLIIFPVLFEYLSVHSKLQSFLIENGISATIKDIKLFYLDRPYYFYVPVTYFIDTDNGIYYVTLDEFLMENNNIIDEYHAKNDYFKCIYTEDEYRNRYQLYDGKIIINSQELIDENIKFQTMDMDIPLRALFEFLGYTVKWDSQNKTVALKKDNNEIEIQLISDIRYICKNFEVESDFRESYYEMRNDRIIIHTFELESIFEYLGLNIEYNFDRENRTITINY